jgi:transcriptional adapter 2-alpha
VIEQHSIPIYDPEWGADEELLLLEGAEVYGLGSWADIADHIGGFRTKEEVKEHYIKTYIESKNFPLPDRADPYDLSLTEEIPRDEFQARKKRRIEERKEAQKNAPPAAPKQKPTSSVPSCHEVQGYMPGRLEFETELHNDAEEAVQHMQFDPGEGNPNPRTGTTDPEFDLKMVIMDIYNSKLTARALRKKSIFEHNLLEYRKNAAIDKKRTKEERELFNKVKPFSRMLNHAEFDAFATGIEFEHNLRLAIAQLQDWRQHGIGDLKTGEKYEAEKAQRVARPAATGAFDRLPGARPPKQPIEPKTHSEATDFVAPDLPERLKSHLLPASAAKNNLSNGSTKQASISRLQTNGTTPLPRSTYIPAPVPGIKPMDLYPHEHSDIHLLSTEEKELCSALHMAPKAWLVMKEALIREATRHGGGLKRKSVRELCHVEAGRSQRIWEFLVRAGWVGRV